MRIRKVDEGCSKPPGVIVVHCSKALPGRDVRVSLVPVILLRITIALEYQLHRITSLDGGQGLMRSLQAIDGLTTDTDKVITGMEVNPAAGEPSRIRWTRTVGFPSWDHGSQPIPDLESHEDGVLPPAACPSGRLDPWLPGPEHS